MTPGRARTALRSMDLMRPLATALETTKPWARSGLLNSAAYFAVPVTLATPSTRDSGLPMLLGSITVMGLKNGFHRLRLRRSSRGLLKGADDGAARELDLEIVVSKARRAFQNRICGLGERSAIGFPLVKKNFGRLDAPGLVGHAAKRDPRQFDCACL